MFSLNQFYNILHTNLISKLEGGKSIYFYPFGTYDYMYLLQQNKPFNKILINSVDELRSIHPYGEKIFFHCYFFDQEPIYNTTLPIIKQSIILDTNPNYPSPSLLYGIRKHHIVAVSEKSEFIREFCRQNYFYDWYYFYHGFAALDWYRDYQYVDPSIFEKFTKVFICYNHLISKYRSYRLHLVSNLIHQNLTQKGLVSLFLSDKDGSWKDAISQSNSLLDKRAKVKIYRALKNTEKPLTIDTNNPNGTLSAEVNLVDLTQALWHIVTETVYFFPKLHLTEKVFKPIIAQRPFILVAAPGNLAYLKSYGFRTFDRWIDESYDQEQDNYIRIEKITAEIERLCALSMEELKIMHQEMQEILEYNYNHFYGKFKHVIVDEMVDNFDGILSRINNGREPNNHSAYHTRKEIDKTVLEEVKQRLLK